MKSNKAFTIVELLVVIAIIAVVSSAGMASYTTMSKQQKVTNATKKLRDVLETAKRKAITGEGNDLCAALPSPMDTLDGYEVSLPAPREVPQVQILLNVVCESSSDPGNKAYSTIATYPIDSSLTVPSLPIRVDFKTLTGAATFVEGNSPINIQSGSSSIKCISVSSLGVMSEEQDAGCSGK
jgi:prepilin-type N-terminal cleavage/methylation domain-containing protein